MTALPQTLVNVEVDPAGPTAAALVAETAEPIAEVERQLAGTGRVLVRPSGTEPLVRVMVEAPTAELAESAARGIAEAIRGRSLSR